MQSRTPIFKSWLLGLFGILLLGQPRALAQLPNGQTSLAGPDDFQTLADQLQNQIPSDPSEFLRRLGKGAGRVVNVSLIPYGRSPERRETSPEKPRTLVSWTGAANSKQHVQVLLAYSPVSKQMQFISVNRVTGQSQFRILEQVEFRTSSPKFISMKEVHFAAREACLACHQSGQALYSNSPWSETAANPDRPGFAHAYNNFHPGDPLGKAVMGLELNESADPSIRAVDEGKSYVRRAGGERMQNEVEIFNVRHAQINQCVYGCSNLEMNVPEQLRCVKLMKLHAELERKGELDLNRDTSDRFTAADQESLISDLLLQKEFFVFPHSLLNDNAQPNLRTFGPGEGIDPLSARSPDPDQTTAGDSILSTQGFPATVAGRPARLGLRFSECRFDETSDSRRGNPLDGQNTLVPPSLADAALIPTRSPSPTKLTGKGAPKLILRYCSQCHSGQQAIGGPLPLTDLQSLILFHGDGDRTAANLVESKLMPPLRAAQPAPEERALMLRALKKDSP